MQYILGHIIGVPLRSIAISYTLRNREPLYLRHITVVVHVVSLIIAPFIECW